MFDLIQPNLDASRLLLDLKLAGELIQQFTGLLEPQAIAARVTEGLVDGFDCAFARLWLVEHDRTTLRLTASAGLYHRLDGHFSRIAMEDCKVGKIAQHGIPFLSNRLAEETWIQDREWVIENKLRGFAGMPLRKGDTPLGVLAVFSHRLLSPEFLEALQMLSLALSAALASAGEYQQLQTQLKMTQQETGSDRLVLSETISQILGQQRLSLVGNEQSLIPAANRLLLQTAERLAILPCHYCRLVYDEDVVVFEVMLATTAELSHDPRSWLIRLARDIRLNLTEIGGYLQTQSSSDRTVTQLRLELPLSKVLWIPKPIQEAEPPEGLLPLSRREREVLSLLAEGLRDRDIAERLFISESTVKFHINNSLTKLQAKNRYQGIYQATLRGLL